MFNIYSYEKKKKLEKEINKKKKKEEILEINRKSI